MFKTGDVNTEKHVPFIQEVSNGYLVKVGKPADHPMTEEHYITEITLIVDGAEFKHELRPNDKPEHLFQVTKGSKVIAREHCNLHGTWENTL